MSKVFDLFMYSGEEDILDIRLSTLDHLINKFLILESNYSHSLIKKPLFFQEQKNRFEQFKDKIIYIVYDSLEQNFFVNDWKGRMALYEAVPDKAGENIIIASDVDEIPNPEKLEEIIKDLKQPINLSGDYFFWTLDLWGRNSNDAIILKKDWIRDSFYKYRDARNGDFFKRINKASWHYSSVGVPEQIARKWTYFAHANELNNKYKDPEYIKKQIKRRAGSWDEKAPDNELTLIPHEYPFLPKYLLNNKEKFSHLFYEYYSKP